MRSSLGIETKFIALLNEIENFEESEDQFSKFFFLIRIIRGTQIYENLHSLIISKFKDLQYGIENLKDERKKCDILTSLIFTFMKTNVLKEEYRDLLKIIDNLDAGYRKRRLIFLLDMYSKRTL